MNEKWTLVVYLLAMVAFIGIIILIRFWIIGGEFNECFWAKDVGTCLALRNK